ncbi:hypothetical protein YC2023_033161 [Brassica napus]
MIERVKVMHIHDKNQNHEVHMGCIDIYVVDEWQNRCSFATLLQLTCLVICKLEKRDSHHPRTLGPTQLKRTIPPLFLLLPVKSPALVGPSPSSSGTDRLCSVLRPFPTKTRRDSVLPAPLFLPCHFYPMLWPRISAVFERYGRRVSFFPPSPDAREVRSEVNVTTRLPPPLAAAHGEERERRRGEREERRRRGEERERRERRGEERERRERRRGGQRRSRRLGLLISGNSLQGFASRFLMREKEVEACFIRERERENPRVF